MTEMKRIVAYTMHEHEQSEAQARLSQTLVADGFVIGDSDSATIDELRKRGIVVRELGPVTEPATPAASLASAALPYVPEYVVVKLREPLCEPHRYELEAAGLELSERLGNTSFIAKVKDDAAPEKVSALSYVEQVREYTTPVRSKPERPQQRAPGKRGPPAAPGLAPGAAPVVARAPDVAADQALQTELYDVVLHDPSRRIDVESYAAQNKIKVVAASSRKLRVRATLEQAKAINDLDGVLLVDEYVQPRLYNDRARGLVWPAAPVPAPLTGADEIVAVADSGIDEQHLVFQGRVRKVVARGRTNDASDPHGHGTHVAASIVGGSGTQLGMAPAAKLVFQSVMDDEGNLSGLPLELDDLFKEAYDEGARIHNDSWGADLGAAYAVTSLEVDRFIFAHKDMLVVVAAGNAGNSLAPALGQRRTQVGFVEWGSVGAPGTSKNALVVGASRSDRTDGGLAKLKYGDVWPDEFIDPPIAAQAVSGDPECMAGFSSRGPCNDRRIKPDVVAPGTDILSARASTAPPSNFAEVIQRNGAAYGYMSGTSMAAPLVAGLAVLVREYLRVQRGHAEPSAALLKAIIVNGARRLSGVDATADHADLPNFHQGFGVVHLPTTLPLDGSFQLAFVDNWKTPAEHMTKPGMRRRYRFTTTKPGALRVSLVYTDPPGRGVQNDLSLFVEMPGGMKRVGNESVPLAVFHPDPDNNVETVRLENAPPGDYLIQVTSTTILLPPQDFALVVTGALAKPTLDQA